MNTYTLKHFDQPDEIRNLPKTKVEIVNLDNGNTMMRATFQPGWKWMECVKPTVGTATCQVPHVLYIISGKMKIVMDDGGEMVMGPGDGVEIAPGHNAWVVGDEPCVLIDFTGGSIYGKPVE